MALCQGRSPPHPRDGPWAWLVCFSCFLTNFIMFGIMLSYGVLLPVFMKEFNTSKGVTAWIGSLAMGTAFLCTPVCTKIVNFFGERTVGFCSGLLAAALVFGSSYAKNITILFFTNGMMYGFLASCCICSMSKCFLKYFKKHIGIASGILTAGGSLGVLVFTPLIQALVDLLGWRSTFKILTGFVVLAGLACLSFDPNVEGSKKVQDGPNNENQGKRTRCGKHFDCSIWRSPKYTIATISIFLNFLCLYVPFVHMITFAKDRGIPPSKSSLLFIYSGLLSTIARVGIGKIVDWKWLTPLQCIQLSSYIVGLSLLLFTIAEEYYQFVLFILCYALGNGIFVSCQYTFLMTCFKDRQKNYFGFSMCYTVTSFALLSGSPIAGFVADTFNSYVPAFYIFGGLVILSGTLPFCLLLIRKNELNTEIESHLELIGSRLASVESTLMINM